MINMRLRIIETNFTTNHDWLFKLADETMNDYYILHEAFYKAHNINSPITKKELDQWDTGQWINVSVNTINGRRIVIAANPC